MKPNKLIERDQTLYLGDCLDVLPNLPTESIDIIITSPPYNIGTNYKMFDDNQPRGEYLPWMNLVFSHLYNILKPDGSFFLNLGFTSTDPWIAFDVANEARKHFVLQNHFCWVKSISTPYVVNCWKDNNWEEEVIWGTLGHFKPINSKRFVNNCWEHLFHFTKSGNVPLDRLGVGVPYTDKGNLNRGGRGKNGDIRCRGNTWFIPYKTIQAKSQKGEHPAVFPEQLVDQCIRLHGLRDDLVVLDPFLGSGTTLKVCQDLGVRGIGIEIDETCIDWTCQRLNE